ncbi:unnamed protein product, partial [Didymodactylos carnosus]
MAGKAHETYQQAQADLSITGLMQLNFSYGNSLSQNGNKERRGPRPICRKNGQWGRDCRADIVGPEGSSIEPVGWAEADVALADQTVRHPVILA